MKKKIFLKTLLFILFSISGFSQMTIKFPVERMVFQRNNFNLGNIEITGMVSQECDRIEARLVARVEGQGQTTDWITIDSEVAGRSFTGKIQNTGGWYTLEVRGVKSDNVLFIKTVDRVGIGEVFVIAGQSNAQGDGDSPNAIGASDDRVNAFMPNFFNSWSDIYENLPEYFGEFSFTKIDAYTNIGPGGNTAWCYGELGDMLVSRLNVPVLFFNAAFTGTSSRNWRLSADGHLVYHEEFGFNAPILPQGAPYSVLSKVLKSFTKTLGLRSILWHQGEYDNQFGTSYQEYYENMRYLINKSRTDTNENIPWVIARVSLINRRTNSNIIAAQNNLVSNLNYMWPGPETDVIQPNRYDLAHFQNTPGSMGLSELAAAWSNSLSDDFFSAITPVTPYGLIKLNHYCLSQNNIRLSLNQAFNYYIWNNGSSSSSIDVNYGTYSAIAKDAYGNIFHTGSINVSNVHPQSAPIVSSTEGLVGCYGKGLSLDVSASSKYQTLWNTGAAGNQLLVYSPGTFSAQYKSNQNCYSSSSQSVSVDFKSPPEKPNLYFLNSDGNACDGDSLNIAISNIQGADILWSTGETNNQISINSSNTQEVYATLYSLPNCPSEQSDVLNYMFYDTPGVPTITKEGPFYLKATSLNETSNYHWRLNDAVVSNELNDIISINESGSYKAQASLDYTTSSGGSLSCYSAFSEVLEAEESNSLSGLVIFPNPVSDGRLSISSNVERENVVIKVYNISGGLVYQSTIDNLSYPQVLDLTTLHLKGKYFLQFGYEAQTKTFPVVFMK